MTTLAAGRSTPGNIASGSWDVTALNTGRLVFSFTFAQSSASGAYSGFRAFYANGDGGLYLVGGVFNIYNNAAGGTSIYGQTLTWAAGATVTWDINSPGNTVTISGALTGNVTNQGFSRGAVPIFTSGQPLGVMQWTDGSFNFSGLGTISDLTDGVTGTSADAAITLGALTASGAIDSPPLDGSATITLGTLTASSTANVEHVASSSIALGALTIQAAGPVGMSVGSATVKQRINAAQPPTGTFTTDPIETTTGTVLVACLMRGRWTAAADPKAPTDSQGNTWTLVGSVHNYATYPNSAAAVYWCVNASGSASHTFTMTHGDDGAGGGDEVTISVVELHGVAMVDSNSHVERATAATITASQVTPSGPSIVLAWVCGNGPVGITHDFQPTTSAALAGWEGVEDGAASGDPSSNGYIQVEPFVLVDADGSGTGTAQALVAHNPAASEGAQMFQLALQMAAGALGDAGLTLGALTVASTGEVPVLADSIVTLGVLTTAATANVEHVATTGLTLGALVTIGTASAEHVAEAAIVLGALTVAGGSSLEVAADVAIQLGEIVLAASSLESLDADAAIVLSSLALQSTASETTPTPGPTGRIWTYWVDDIFATIFVGDDMTNDERRVRQSETPKTINARAFTKSGYPDLTGYTTLRFRMVGPVTIEGDAVADSDGNLFYTFTADQLDELGTYEARFTGVAPDGEPRSFPEETNLRVVVIAA